MFFFFFLNAKNIFVSCKYYFNTFYNMHYFLKMLCTRVNYSTNIPLIFSNKGIICCFYTVVYYLFAWSELSWVLVLLLSFGVELRGLRMISFPVHNYFSWLLALLVKSRGNIVTTSFRIFT